MNRRDFERIVRNTINRLPERFQYALENVAIVVEEEPTQEDGGPDLFGLYEGTPLLGRSAGDAGTPDQIRIFRQPILRACSTPLEVAAEIRDTVIHELGHHMGLDDDEMPY
jgi:predicted Zn-dependent protease with MMP-like domain